MDSVTAHGQQTNITTTDAGMMTTDRATYEQFAARQAAEAQPAAPVDVQPRPAVVSHDFEDTLRAEVATETERLEDVDDEARDYPDGAVAVPLEGAKGRRGVVHILPVDDWPSSAMSALHVGDFESWADGCLALDDYEQVWMDLDPSIGQVKALMDEWKALTGQDTGKSNRSPRSLRRTARR